ncbi:MAG: ABC transporter ATP-binding protein [Gammaproteobacteria bacterium]|nr:ABC transporter ATP-binding protein [Gammaproteobacteria bacterium]
MSLRQTLRSARTTFSTLSPPAVSVNNVHKHFGNLKALTGIDLEIQRGEFFGLLGPNGAGKSTLISALAGLVRVDAGSLAVMGHDVVSQYRYARRLLGVVPQELIYDPFFTVRETLEFQAGYFGLKGHSGGWIDELLCELNLFEKANTNTRALSGGMKRRLLIGQALVHKPPVVVLDEPTAGVDVELRKSLWQFIKRLHGEGHTIVLTTHYLEEAESLCERIAILDRGEIVALDSKSALLSSGMQRRLHVYAAQAVTRFPDALRPKVIRIDGNHLELQLHKKTDSVMAVLDTLRGAGIEPRDIKLQDDNLEDVFVQLTGHKIQ